MQYISRLLLLTSLCLAVLGCSGAKEKEKEKSVPAPPAAAAREPARQIVVKPESAPSAAPSHSQENRAKEISPLPPSSNVEPAPRYGSQAASDGDVARNPLREVELAAGVSAARTFEQRIRNEESERE